MDANFAVKYHICLISIIFIHLIFYFHSCMFSILTHFDTLNVGFAGTLSYGKWSTAVLNNSLSCIAQKVTLSIVFLFMSLLRQKKNSLPPFAMEKLGSICSYGNNDSRFKIWRYTFYHFRSYSTWKIVAISAHCIMEIHHRIFHRFFPLKNGTKMQLRNSRDSWEAGEAAGEWKFFVFIALSGNQKRWPLCTKM